MKMEDLRVPAIAFAAAVVGGVITLIGQMWTSSREYDAKMVEIAMGVLRAPYDKDLQGVRTWALNVINRHSGTTLESKPRPR